MTATPEDREDKLVAEAITLVEELQRRFAKTALAAVVGRLEMQLRVGLLISRRAELNIILGAIGQCANIQHTAPVRKGSDIPEDNVKVLAREAAKVVRQKKAAPTYKTQVFKCLGDYENCAERGGKRVMICLALAVICIAKQVIPFAPSEPAKG